MYSSGVFGNRALLVVGGRAVLEFSRRVLGNSHVGSTAPRERVRCECSPHVCAYFAARGGKKRCEIV